MPLVEETTTITGEGRAIFEIIKDFEAYPTYMTNVKKVETLSRDDDKSVTKWYTEVDGRNIVWSEEDKIDDESMRIEFTQVEGDLKLFNGFWQVEPSAQPAAQTEKGPVQKVTFSIYFEFGIPMLAALLHPLLSKKLRENMVEMLNSIKTKVETTS